jgi:hypothetical protein
VIVIVIVMWMAAAVDLLLPAVPGGANILLVACVLGWVLVFRRGG